MDLVEAPAPVLAYFCQIHKLHTVPIADQLTERQVDAFINGQNQIPKFYTGNMRVSIAQSTPVSMIHSFMMLQYYAKRSRFVNKVITNSSQVK